MVEWDVRLGGTLSQIDWRIKDIEQATLAFRGVVTHTENAFSVSMTIPAQDARIACGRAFTALRGIQRARWTLISVAMAPPRETVG